MKKALVTFCILVLTGSVGAGIFWENITASQALYSTKQQDPTIIPRSIITWKTLSYSSGEYAAANSPLQIGTLSVPVPFSNADYIDNQTTVSAAALGRSISVASPRQLNFFAEHNLNAGEEQTICNLLLKTSGQRACDSDLSLYLTLLQLEESDVHFFSPAAEKALLLPLLKIRTELTPSQTAYNFETRSVQGVLFALPNGTFVAHIFDDREQLYEVTFSGLGLAEVTAVLSSVYEG